MRLRLDLLSITLIATLASTPAFAQNLSDQFYEAIRNNNLDALAALEETADVNVRDKYGSTPLMYAAAFGSAEAMRSLVSKGANVNARNSFEATALMWAITQPEKVKLLVSKGADVNARSKMGRTPLLVAASNDGSSATVKLLLEKGANISAADVKGTTPLLAATAANDTATIELLLDRHADVSAKDLVGFTPLLNAAGKGNVKIVRALLARGADVNAATAPKFEDVKNGPIAIGNLTPLLASATYSGPGVVRALLEAGAKVDARDVRGMTPLMLAVATDHPNARVLQMLIDAGADPNAQDRDNTSVVEWAKKFNNPAVLKLFGLQPVPVTAASLVEPADSTVPDARRAIERSVDLLQRTATSSFREGGCASCHSHNVPAIAVTAAHVNGLRFDASVQAETAKATKLQWASAEQPLLQRMDPPVNDIETYALFEMANEETPADRTTDAMVHNIAAQQQQTGQWRALGLARPPMEDGDFSRTALAIRALKAYGLEGRKGEFEKRVQLAAAWLRKSTPTTTEDRSMQLLGLIWAGTDPASLKDKVRQIVAEQRADGGWAQNANLASDAYATGEVLYTLRQAGFSAADPAYVRGVQYLLRTQREDGSWLVKSRSPKFQPYFESGFPYAGDQWISAAATAWASLGLSSSISTPVANPNRKMISHSKAGPAATPKRTPASGFLKF